MKFRWMHHIYGVKLHLYFSEQVLFLMLMGVLPLVEIFFSYFKTYIFNNFLKSYQKVEGTPLKTSDWLITIGSYYFSLFYCRKSPQIYRDLRGVSNTDLGLSTANCWSRVHTQRIVPLSKSPPWGEVASALDCPYAWHSTGGLLFCTDVSFYSPNYVALDIVLYIIQMQQCFLQRRNI